MNKLIWCEVSCGRCGAAATNCGYYSPELIKKLKAETKAWKHDDQYRCLCPNCQQDPMLKRERKDNYYVFGL